MSTRNLLLAVLLIASAIGSWMLSRRVDTVPDASPPSRQEPGYYVTDARIVGLDTDGTSLYELTAKRIRQMPADGSVELTDPRLDYAPQTGIPWVMEADAGRIPDNGETLDLQGNVRLSSLPESGRDAVVLQTDHLEVAMRERIATSAGKVIFSQRGQHLEGRGLHADLTSDRMRLRADVRGHFGP